MGKRETTNTFPFFLLPPPFIPPFLPFPALLPSHSPILLSQALSAYHAAQHWALRYTLI